MGSTTMNDTTLKRTLETPEKEVGDAKKQKVEVDFKELCKQIHYYFSDENLAGDKFFHTKITEDAEGYLDVSCLLQCKKVMVLKATDDDILASIKESKELESKIDGDKKFVRRIGNKELPKLVARKQEKKDGRCPYDGGVVLRITNMPEWAAWGDAKDAVKGALPKDIRIAFCTTKKEGEEGQGEVVDMIINPFANDVELATKLCEAELIIKEDLERKAKAKAKRAAAEKAKAEKEAEEKKDGDDKKEEAAKPVEEEKKAEEAAAPAAEAKVGSAKVIMLADATLKRVLSMVPKWVNKKREEFARAARQKRQVKIHLGEQVFPNINAVKSKVKEVLNARMPGQELKQGSPDYTLMTAVFKHHPRAEEKTKGMIGLRVDKHPQYPESTCFMVVREGGECEDISTKKCLDILQVKATQDMHKKDTENKEADKKAAEEKKD